MKTTAWRLLVCVGLSGCSKSGGEDTSGLSPEAASAESPAPAGALRDAVIASQGKWKGKEVTVVGDVLTTSPTKDGMPAAWLPPGVGLRRAAFSAPGERCPSAAA
jgi:hypothetical protein